MLKKTLAIFLTVILLLSAFVSCGGGTETATETKSESASESVTASETESETASETESETESETVSETESETESETVSETESETVSETESETASETESESESETETKPERPTTPQYAVPKIIITEIAFNPTFRENSFGISKTGDVFEFIEITNPTNRPIDISGWTVRRRIGGFSGTEVAVNQIYASSDNKMVLEPGGVAILHVYTSLPAKMGLGYATDVEIDALRAAFCEFYGVDIPLSHFYVCPQTESGRSTKIEGAFNLPNEAELDAYELIDSTGKKISEAEFSPKYWNRNDRSCHFAFVDGGETQGHPFSVRTLGVSFPSPYRLTPNQVFFNPALIPPSDAISFKLMQYNICASGVDLAAEGMTELQRITFRKDGVLGLIREQSPDVMVLNEVNYAWVPILTEELIGKGYAAFGYSVKGNEYSTLKSDLWDICNLILWRSDLYDLVDSGHFWLSSTPDFSTTTWFTGGENKSPCCTNWVILRDKASGTEFFVLGLHLPVNSDGSQEIEQQNCVNLILKKAKELSGGRPVILTGDWNATRAFNAYAIMERSAYTNAAYLTDDTWIGGSTNSWGKYKDNYQSNMAIDHTFVSADTVFVDRYYTDMCNFDTDAFGSDHNAMFVDLCIINREAD